MPVSLLPHFNSRPPGTAIDTIVIHSIYAPGSIAPLSAQSVITLLDQNCVASHYAIDRSGSLWTIVPENLRAWHAGESRMPFNDDERTNVNDFSVGVELLARPDQHFSAAQYSALRTLCFELMMRYPIRAIVGHDQIAPARKTDPGKLFNWQELQSLVNSQTKFPRILQESFPRLP